MKKYYEPDSRWEMYQINSKDEYAKAFVIDGCFHDQVPEDILKAYNTVEYLMAHAYYHWPMYDEAFHKVLLTIEMGIKLKAKQLDIPLFRRKKNGERWYRKLSDLIDDICEKAYLSDLKRKLDRSRDLRNMQAHPKQNSFSGAMGGIPRNIKYCVNVLNRLFRSEEWHIKQQKQIQKFGERFGSFENKLLIVENGNGKRVMSSILDFDIIDNSLFITFLPIFDVKKLKANNNEDILPDPVTYTIQDYELYDNQIVGRTHERENVKLYSTEREDLVEAFNRFQKYLQNNSVQNKRIYTDFMTTEVPWHLSNAEYKYLAECD